MVCVAYMVSGTAKAVGVANNRNCTSNQYWNRTVDQRGRVLLLAAGCIDSEQYLRAPNPARLLERQYSNHSRLLVGWHRRRRLECALHPYQSQDYFVKFIHNHLIQMALDIGVFGFLIFVAGMGIYYWTAIKRLRATKHMDETSVWTKGSLLLVSAMLLHASFDFDLTFPFLFGVLVCLMLPMDGNLYRLRITGRVLGFIIPSAAVAVCLSGWLAVGYGSYRAGNTYVKVGQYIEAQTTFTKAERLLPWSSSVLYGSAKGYILQGNATGDPSYYRLAEEKLERAHRMVPDQMLYIDLLNQIRDFSTEND